MLEAMVNDELKSFKDGGIRENNPSGAALSEFHALYEGRASEPALMLSIGTGRPNQSHDGFAAAWPSSFGRLAIVSKFLEKRAVIQNLLIKYTEGEKQHKQMREHAHGEHTWYKRLNVSEGLESMPLDLWEKGDWTDPKTGKVKEATTSVSLILNTKDVRTLSSGTPTENEYADFANKMKSLANRARKEAVATPNLNAAPSKPASHV